jgi:hypothetical protein
MPTTPGSPEGPRQRRKASHEETDEFKSAFAAETDEHLATKGQAPMKPMPKPVNINGPGTPTAADQDLSGGFHNTPMSAKFPPSRRGSNNSGLRTPGKSARKHKENLNRKPSSLDFEEPTLSYWTQMKRYISGPGTPYYQKQWWKFREPGTPYSIFVFFVCPLGALSILHLLVMYADSDISRTTFWAAVCVLFIVYIWITIFVYRRLYKSAAAALAKEKGESKLQRKIAEDALQKAHEAVEEFKARDANVSTLQADLEEIKRALRMEIALRGMAEENLRALIPNMPNQLERSIHIHNPLHFIFI